MWPNAKSCFRKYWKGFEILAKTLCVKSWFRFSFSFFYVDFSFSISFQSFFTEKSPSTSEKKIMQITYSVPSVESLKLLTIIIAEMDQNGRRSNCATLNKIICYIGTRIKNDLYSMQSKNKIFRPVATSKAPLKQINGIESLKVGFYGACQES